MNFFYRVLVPARCVPGLAHVLEVFLREGLKANEGVLSAAFCVELKELRVPCNRYRCLRSPGALEWDERAK